MYLAFQSQCFHSHRLRSPKAPDANADMGQHHISFAAMPHAGGTRDISLLIRTFLNLIVSL